MKNIKVSLVDNDYVVRVKTDLSDNDKDNTLIKFIQHINEEFVPGETAYLEIEGFEENPITFEISR
jgi:hypothetical protein